MERTRRVKSGAGSAVVAGAACSWVAASCIAAQAPTLERIGRLRIDAAEIPAYDPATRTLFVTGAGGVSTVSLADPTAPVITRTLDIAALLGDAAGVLGAGGEVSHVSVDPLGRGFAAATIIPAERAAAPGRIVFFATATGASLGGAWAGYGPDNLTFAPDGSSLAVADEGEPVALPGGGVADPPGAVTVVRLDGVHRPEDLEKLPAGAVVTITLGGPALRAALEPARARAGSIRINPYNAATPELDLEPEYIAIAGGVAYVTLQENNAVATLDLTTLRWRRIDGLGVIEQTIDASDRDGAARVDRVVAGMPMPDHIGAWTAGGRMLLITANEGDDRGEAGKLAPPFGDVERIAKLAKRGRLSNRAKESLDLSDDGVGRLNVCVFTGATLGDGRIDRPTMLGTRSASVWDAATMTRLADTGDAFERTIAERFPSMFNADYEGVVDARSDDRGPEPEGVALASIDGREIAFISLERPGAVATLDVSTPEAIRVLDIQPCAMEGDLGPEGMVFIPAEQSPTRAPLLAAAFEASGTVCVYTVRLP